MAPWLCSWALGGRICIKPVGCSGSTHRHSPSHWLLWIRVIDSSGPSQAAKNFELCLGSVSILICKLIFLDIQLSLTCSLALWSFNATFFFHSVALLARSLERRKTKDLMGAAPAHPPLSHLCCSSSEADAKPLLRPGCFWVLYYYYPKRRLRQASYLIFNTERPLPNVSGSAFTRICLPFGRCWLTPVQLCSLTKVFQDKSLNTQSIKMP